METRALTLGIEPRCARLLEVLVELKPEKSESHNTSVKFRNNDGAEN